MTTTAPLIVTAYRIKGRRGSIGFSAEPAPAPPPTSQRPAHIAHMLALAHHIEAAIERGVFETAAAAYRKLGLDNARIYQVLGLRRLAPDIQEDVLFLLSPDGIEPFTEKALREIAGIPAWAEQRRRYAALRPSFRMSRPV